jgi:carbonic anhydrase
MGDFDEVVESNAHFAEGFNLEHLAAKPSRGIAILTCMDSRIPIAEGFGIELGQAHVIRNAGALATDDALRSLVVSRELMGTSLFLVIGHTDCGLLNTDDEELRQRLASKTGQRVDIRFGSFNDLAVNVREQVGRVRRHPWLKGAEVHGLVYDVRTGRLETVT